MRQVGYRTVERTVEEKVIISEACFCDICAKEIRNSFWHISHPMSAMDKVQDGDKTYDICSKDCMVKFMEANM